MLTVYIDMGDVLCDYSSKIKEHKQKFGYEMTQNLIICSHKGLLKGDLLIDDHASGRGQEFFEGQLIHFGHKEYPNWEAVLISLPI